LYATHLFTLGKGEVTSSILVTGFRKLSSDCLYAVV
jgi:hypothetical protein